MVANEHEFIIKASLSAAQLPSFTKPNKDFRLFVEFIIPNSEGEHYILKRTFGLIVEYELIDASRSEGAQAAVKYHSKISLHFGKDFAIFCEGEWRQNINNNDANTNCIIFNKDVSHQVDVLVIKSILILISEGAQVAPATLQTFAEGDQATPQNPSLSLKFIDESLSKGAQIAPTTFQAFE